MKKRWVIIGILLLAVAGYFLLTIPPSPTPDSPSPIRKSRYVAAEGKVEAMPGLDVEVGSELPGKIDKFFVNEGDRIEKGEKIAQLWNKDIEAKLKEAEQELIVAKSRLKEVASGAREEEIKRAAATLDGAVADMDVAKNNFKRYEELYKEGVIPKALLDEKEGALKMALARVREATEEKRLLERGPKKETLQLYENSVKQVEATVEYYRRLLEKTLIVAPISGKVIHKYLQEGETVNMSNEITPLIAIADLEKIRISAEVDETDADMVHIGDSAEITSDAYPGRILKGEIQEISDYVGVREVRPNNPAKNLDRKVLRVKIGIIGEAPLKLGMTVNVRIVSQKGSPSL